MVTIIDYGLGNLASIKNMLKRISVPSLISSSPEEINNAEKLILPGVGHFAKGMENLARKGLISVLNKKVLEDKTPILGICLGMQLFSMHSEEGDVDGLGWIKANTVRFQFEDPALKIPHMGWGNVKFLPNKPFAKELISDARFYFVHSYHVKCGNEEDVLGTSNYGFEFHAAVQYNNIIGVQFHPEKSHKFGMRLLKNFNDIK